MKTTQQWIVYKCLVKRIYLHESSAKKLLFPLLGSLRVSVYIYADVFHPCTWRKYNMYIKIEGLSSLKAFVYLSCRKRGKRLWSENVNTRVSVIISPPWPVDDFSTNMTIRIIDKRWKFSLTFSLIFRGQKKICIVIFFISTVVFKKDVQ